MNYDITNLLNLKGDKLNIIDIKCDYDQKTIIIEKQLEEHVCPKCGHKMYSKGPKTRTILHPVFRDGEKLIIKFQQRRWLCSNENCKYNLPDKVSFVGKNRRTTNFTELSVLESFRDINKTAAQIAKEHNISDHLAMDIFNKYIHMDRLPLPSILCVDEVYLNMDNRCKYALVLQDFITSEPVDLVKSRQKKVTENYFFNIPYEERKNVKYLISDMYQPYIRYTEEFFPNALPIVDSFHVMQWLITKIDSFCRKLLKEFKERDEKNAREKAIKLGKNPDTVDIPLSDEVYLLQKHRWVILENVDNIKYSHKKKYNPHFKRYMDTYSIEEEFFKLHKDFYEIRELKEEYVQFNNLKVSNDNLMIDLDNIAAQLVGLITNYENSHIRIFNDFSKTLNKNFEPIVNSFTFINKIAGENSHMVRLSNGPIESLNRKAKDLKRNSRGYLNFNNFRNRFLFCTRRDSSIINK